MTGLLSRDEEAELSRLVRSQPESSGELAERFERLAGKAVEAALSDRGVRERLANARHRVLSTDFREDKAVEGQDAPPLAEVGVYDYDRDVLVVVAVDLRTGEVVEVVDRDGAAPPITVEELEEARELAAGVPDVGPALRSRARLVVFPTPSYAFDARPDARCHRGCVLYVKGLDGEELSVVVDLTAGEVVSDADLPEILRSGRGAPSSSRFPEED